MTRPSTRALVVVGVVVALLLAGVASFYASSDPDGLSRVAEDQGIAATEREHKSGDGPLAGYETTGVEDDRLSTLVAGVTGSLVVLALFGGLTLVLRRRARADAGGRTGGATTGGDTGDAE